MGSVQKVEQRWATVTVCAAILGNKKVRVKDPGEFENLFDKLEECFFSIALSHFLYAIPQAPSVTSKKKKKKCKKDIDTGKFHLGVDINKSTSSSLVDI